jgi:eukaryotic-like serine/threonine-protein kinase
MPLTPGARLGPYQVVAPLGAGGMGEVYKARDTRLDRTVAIKTLLGDFLTDPALRARFEREARAISSLDHPNICVIHDVGREGEIEYLVMQYVEGETLAARLQRGPLTLDEALRYGAGIAAALDKAHRAGILHRDLKPANVMLASSAGRDASAKLLDFGLAKLLPAAGIATDETVPSGGTSPLTGRGTILGTLLYMSPEQLQGGAVDARSDIFSFGAVLYEMLTGTRAFEGTSQASIIAAILERDPSPLIVAAPVTPPALDRVVRKCLAKDPDRRWQSAADLCDELTWIAQAPAVVQHSASSSTASMGIAPSRPRASRLALAALGAVILLAGGAVGWWLARGDDRTAAATRHLAITVPGTARLEPGGLAISPDGESIVFVAADVAPGADPATAPRRRRLYWRELGSSTSTLIPGTEDARAPFFSPDGQTVAYFTGVDLMKVALRGGTPVRVIGTPPVTRGGVWLSDGSLVVAPTQGDPLFRLPAGAAATVPLTTLDEGRGERGHAWPQPLPGSADVLFTVRHGTATDVESSDIAIVDVATGRREVVMQGAAFGQYSPTGHLLFVKGGALSAAPFDLASRKVTGPARIIVDRVAVDAWTGGAHFGVTADGTLLFFAGRFSEPERKLVWVGRDGKILAGAVSGPQPAQPRISPDGRNAVFTGVSADGDSEILLADLERGTAVRFSEDPADDFNPVWTPDGLAVIWSTMPPNRSPYLVRRAIDGTSKTEAVVPDDNTAQFAGSVAPSGLLAFTGATAAGVSDIMVASLKGPSTPKPLLSGSAREFGPEFSPHGDWIAYVSSESGTNEIYVVPYPGPGARRQITSGGGVSPMWRRDGRELYYQTEAGLMVMDVVPGPQIEFGRPRLLFGGAFSIDGTEDGTRAYDAAADGKRFLMVQVSPSVAPPPTLEVLVNWKH